MTVRPIREDIPTDKAWQTGRRLYVRAGYKSKLNDALRAAGAKWDPEQKALWVGSTKREAVLAALGAADERRAAVEEVKAFNLWLAIPYDAEHVRGAAKKAGALYDGHTKSWAFPDEESHQRVTEMRDRWITEVEEAERLRQVERDREDAEAEREEAEARQRRAAAAREQVIAQSGRVSTGEEMSFTEVSTLRMNKPTALSRARKVGSVVKTETGQRLLITDVKVHFTNEGFASSTCWHPETHDQAHWDFRYTAMVVEPTMAEAADDAEASAAKADAGNIAAVVAEVRDTAERREPTSRTPGEARVGSIILTTGIATVIRAGELILTRDGTLIWTHPGYYDDYIPSEGTSIDPNLVARVRAILAGGARSRTVPGQMPVEYRVVLDA